MMKLPLSLVLALLSSVSALNSHGHLAVSGVMVSVHCVEEELLEECNTKDWDTLRRLAMECAGRDLVEQGYPVHTSPIRRTWKEGPYTETNPAAVDSLCKTECEQQGGSDCQIGCMFFVNIGKMPSAPSAASKSRKLRGAEEKAVPFAACEEWINSFANHDRKPTCQISKDTCKFHSEVYSA